MLFARLLFTTTLLVTLCAPAFAGFGLVLPSTPAVDNPETGTLKILLGAVEPFFGQGIALERPQAFTALRHSGETVDRSEHLSVLEETTAYGARGWTTEIALPHPGVYHFIMHTKAGWVPEQNRFVQYITSTQVPVQGSSEGWDKPVGTGFEIVPLSRPFGLCAGMGFTGQVLQDGKPLPGALVDITRLTTSVKPDVKPEVKADVKADAKQEAKAEAAKQDARARQNAAFLPIQQVKTDSQGVFTFGCPVPGWWAFASSMSGDPLQDPEGKLKPLEIKTVLWIYMDDCKTRTKR
ncbi:MAG: DUF4198 domain-containing protein [Bilophila sp.]